MGLTEGGESDILLASESIAGIKHIPITDEVIRSVPKIDLFDDDMVNQKIHDSIVDLLTEVQTLPPWTEGARSIPLDLTAEIKKSIGDFGEGTVIIPKLDVPYVSIHNHCSWGTFSGDDIRRFVASENEKIIGVIGHNGELYWLEKSKDFNRITFQRLFCDIAYKPDYEQTILREAEKYGFRYYKS